MNKPSVFPVRVQYTEQYLADNPRVRRRKGTANRMTRGYSGVVTITWDNSKAIGHVHLDFLEAIPLTPSPKE